MSENRGVRTRHGRLTLEEIGDALPGTGEVMASVGRCFGLCWHAAHGGNWDLAEYFLRRVRSLMRGLAVTRHKYRKQLVQYDTDLMEPVAQALTARDLAAFELAVRSSATEANRYHVETGHPYIRWVIPAGPPDDGLDLLAGPE